MLRFAPIYKQAPWGDRRRFDEEFGRAIPDGPVGEAWELVDLGEQQSLALTGPRSGQPLGELWRQGALGGSAQGPFPFLLKWVAAADWLSVQVHPDAAACAQLGCGEPKTEAWCVVRADPGALMLLGHFPGLDQATLRQAVAGGTVRKWLYEVGPRPGDLYLVSAGTVHSIGPGLLLFEVQQPSDTTFRLYDWGRLGQDGASRPLHVDEACASIHFTRAGTPRAQRREVTGARFLVRVLPPGTELAAEGLRVLVGHHSPVSLETARGAEQLRFGEVVVAEPADGVIQLGAEACLLVTEAPSPG